MKFRIMKIKDSYTVERFVAKDTWSYNLNQIATWDMWDRVAIFYFKFQAKKFLEKIKQSKLDKNGLEIEKKKLILEVDIAGD